MNSLLPRSLVHKSLLSFTLILGNIVLPGIAQPQTEKPNPRQILDRGVAAMGGKENLASVFSKQIFGTVTRESDGATGTIEILTRAPNAYFFRLTFADQFEQIGFNGISGYHWNTGKDVEVFDADHLKLLGTEAAYRNGIWFRFGSAPSSGNYELVRFEGTGNVQGQPVQTVRLSPGPVSLSFAMDSGLLVSEKTSILTKLSYEYSDFRQVGNVLEPHLIRLTTRNDQTLVVRVNQIVLNQPIADSKFDIPASVQKDLPALDSIISTAKRHQEIIGRNYSQITYQKSYEFAATYESRYDENSFHSPFGYMRKQKFDVSFHRDFPLEILTEDNENAPPNTFKSRVLPIHPSALNKYEKLKERERKKIDRLYQEAAKRGKPLTANDGMEKIKWDNGLVILESLTNSRFTNLHRARFWARDVYVVDFMPAQSSDKNPVSPKEMLAGRLWIDVQSGWVIKADIKTTQQSKKNLLQTVFGYAASGTETYIQQPVCSDLWLPKYRESSASDLRPTYDFYRINQSESLCDANNKSRLK